jgi:sec-independent protein translocase protein TatC
VSSQPPRNGDDKSALVAPTEGNLAPQVDEEDDNHVSEEAAEPVDPEEAEINEHRMTLLEHLSELRVRLRNAFIAFVVAMIGSFVFVSKFFELLTRPVRRGMVKAGFPPELNVMKVTEVFWVYMKLAIIGGVLIASPFVFWELWKFVAPGLYRKERKLAVVVTASTALCFIVGTVFGYFVLCEPAAYYMMSLLHTEKLKSVDLVLKPVLMMDEVADFLMLTLAGCGAAFELPVLVAVLGALGIVTTKALWKFNKYALVLATVLGAVLTPSTDPFTQMLLAVPLFMLYEVSILVVWVIERSRKREEDALEAQYGEDDRKGPAASP